MKQCCWLLLLLCIPGCKGCFRSPNSSASAQQRQAAANADREEELSFRDQSGKMNWRQRIDAAQKALEDADSKRRWGQQQAALERALDAARLMPPPGKDFDLQASLAASLAASALESADPDATQPGSAGSKAGGGEAESDAGTGDEAGGQGNAVTNAEVRQMRQSLEALFEKLDGGGGGSNSELRLDRDLIEIQ